MNQHETTAADVTRAWQCDSKGKAGGYCGVNRVAALLEYGQAGLGSEPLRAHNHVALSNLGYKAGTKINQRRITAIALKGVDMERTQYNEP
jgi:hypothetical protein